MIYMHILDKCYVIYLYRLLFTIVNKLFYITSRKILKSLFKEILFTTTATIFTGATNVTLLQYIFFQGSETLTVSHNPRLLCSGPFSIMLL